MEDNIEIGNQQSPEAKRSNWYKILNIILIFSTVFLYLFIGFSSLGGFIVFIVIFGSIFFMGAILLFLTMLVILAKRLSKGEGVINYLFKGYSLIKNRKLTFFLFGIFFILFSIFLGSMESINHPLFSFFLHFLLLYGIFNIFAFVSRSIIINRIAKYCFLFSLLGYLVALAFAIYFVLTNFIISRPVAYQYYDVNKKTPERNINNSVQYTIDTTFTENNPSLLKLEPAVGVEECPYANNLVENEKIKDVYFVFECIQTIKNWPDEEHKNSYDINLPYESKKISGWYMSSFNKGNIMSLTIKFPVGSAIVAGYQDNNSHSKTFYPEEGIKTILYPIEKLDTLSGYLIFSSSLTKDNYEVLELAIIKKSN